MDYYVTINSKLFEGVKLFMSDGNGQIEPGQKWSPYIEDSITISDQQKDKIESMYKEFPSLMSNVLRGLSFIPETDDSKIDSIIETNMYVMK